MIIIREKGGESVGAFFDKMDLFACLSHQYKQDRCYKDSSAKMLMKNRRYQEYV